MISVTTRVVDTGADVAGVEYVSGACGRTPPRPPPPPRPPREPPPRPFGGPARESWGTSDVVTVLV